MRRRSLAIGLVLVAVNSARAVAQSNPDSSARKTVVEPGSGWLFGASIGVPGYEDEPILELFTVGIHGTHLRGPGRIGFDYSIGTMPRALGEGVVVLGLRTGVALPLTLSPRALLLPSAGLSLVGGASGGGGGGVAGVNVGIAGVAFGSSGAGLRVGVTWHRFDDTNGAIWLAELGVVGLRGRGSRPQCDCKGGS